MANKPEKEKKHFFRNFRAELKKVIWPTPKQVINNTVAVVTIVLVTTVIVLVLDLAFEGLNNFGINRLKTVLANDTSNELVEGDVDNTDTDENPENTDETDENIGEESENESQVETNGTDNNENDEEPGE